MLGQKLSHYHIREQIGAGAMGQVYRAHDERLERDVAIKVLPPGTLPDELSRRRFRKEALALSQLNHPNIATVHDFDTQEGVDFLVMELIPGVTLSDRLSRESLNERDVIRLGLQLAQGLVAAHEHGIIHRDLKPGNLRVTPDGRLKILDFGLAKLLQRGGEVGLTASGSVPSGPSGTLPYMAPEQVLDEPMDVRADIYSAGVVLYEMATGARPFRETHGARLIDLILHKAPEPPSRISRQVSPGMERIILKALDKNPEHRYQTARELMVDLERLASPTTASLAALETQRRRRKYPWAAGIVLLALAATGIYWYQFRSLGPRSIAILPFVNANADPEAEYLSDGITESIINNVSKLPRMRVIAPTSVFRYKGQGLDLKKIGGELRVTVVVTGRILARGEELSISAQLVDIRDNRVIWGQQYNRKMTDLLRTQEEIAREISENLKIRLTGEEQQRLTKRETRDPEAYRLYLQGRYYWNKRTADGFRKAIEIFQQALDRDPNYALAYAGLADTYSSLGSYNILPFAEAAPKAEAAARRAVDLDETLAEGHSSLASVLQDRFDFEGADRQYARAIELNPSYATARHWYGLYLGIVGRSDAAIGELKTALELDPFSPIINANYGFVYYQAGRHTEAIEQLRRTLELDPNFSPAHEYLGQALLEAGRHAEAIAELEKNVALSSGDIAAKAELGYGYGRAGRRQDARRVLSEMMATAQKSYVSPYDIAIVYLGLDQRDDAFQWLEKAYQEHSVRLWNLKSHPRFASVRSDPRFLDLSRRIGFGPDAR
jgi:serine/threonine protein kinase/tetratricopeptide (TPR) repeat protein